MKILLYNLSLIASNKIFNKLGLSNLNRNISVFTNNPKIAEKTIYKNHLMIVYQEVNCLMQYVISEKINILIINNLSFNISDIPITCSIVSMSITNNQKITHINNFQQLMDEYPTESCNPGIITTCQAKPVTILSNLTNRVSDNKSIYRSICMEYLDFFRNIPTPNIRLQSIKESVLVEFRILPHLEVLVRNMIYKLGETWSYTIICGNNNYSTIKEFCQRINGDNKINIINIGRDNMTQNEYNTFLMTSDFWDLLSGEKILLYQEDTCIFKNNIDDFIIYDYVGAPFGPECVTPINVGNGGFSLRTKSVMLKVLENCSPIEFKTKSVMVNNYKKNTGLTLFPEDIYFPQSMQDCNIGTVAPYDVALKFSSEHVFTDDCLGMHCLWFCKNTWKEYIYNYFETIKQQYKSLKIKAYMIHCDDFNDRMSLINDVKTKVELHHVEFNMFNGIDTRNWSLDKFEQLRLLKSYDQNLSFYNTDTFVFYKPGQIGCYLGHHLIIKSIMENVIPEGYSIIFEDDSKINTNFISEIKNIISYFEENNLNEMFDIIYLGHLNNNKGKKLDKNIYKINKENWIFGAHGMIINNKSISKIYNLNCVIRHEIDNHYKLLNDLNMINAYYIDPPLVNQNRFFRSYISY